MVHVFTTALLATRVRLKSELASSLVTPPPATTSYSTVVWRGDQTYKNNFFAFIDQDSNIIFVSILLREKVKAFSKLILNERNAAGVLTPLQVKAIYPSKDKIFAIIHSTVRNTYEVIVFDPTRYLDNSITSNVANRLITGLNRYNNIHADVILTDTGDYLGKFPVVGNQIDLGNTLYTGRPVEVGYAFYAHVETMPVEDIQNIGSSIGKLKNICEVFINPDSIANLTINGHTVLDKNHTTAQKEPFVNRTLLGWDRSKTLQLSQKKPLQWGIKNILTKVEVNA